MDYIRIEEIRTSSQSNFKGKYFLSKKSEMQFKEDIIPVQPFIVIVF